MRRKFAVKLAGHDEPILITTTTPDGAAMERRYGVTVGELFADATSMRWEPLVFMLHRRLTHLSKRGTIDAQIPELKEFTRSVAPGALESFGFHGINEQTGEPDVEWTLFESAWVAQFVGDDEPVTFTPLIADILAAESAKDCSPFELLNSAAGQIRVVYDWAHRTGRRPLPLPDTFAEGEADGAIEWVDLEEIDVGLEVDEPADGDRPFEPSTF